MVWRIVVGVKTEILRRKVEPVETLKWQDDIPLS